MGTEVVPTPLPEVLAKLEAAPERTRRTARTASALDSGLRCTARSRGHEVVVDEPASLSGTDAGPNPVELVLMALGTCQVITYRVWAERLGIRLDDVVVDADGDLDLRGFYGLAEVAPGFDAVRLRVRLAGPEPEERYRELTDAVNRHCPVLDVFERLGAVTREVTVGVAG